MVHHCFPRSSFHSDPISALGSNEDVQASKYRERYDLSGGERCCGKCGGGYSRGDNDTFGCAEDTDDACEGEDRVVDPAEKDLEREWY